MICNECSRNLPLDCFTFNKAAKSREGIDYLCKECKKLKKARYYKSKDGVIQTIYDSQKLSSKHRNHTQPTYSKDELYEWLMNNPLFHTLYQEWVDSGYNRNNKPSVDRINDFESYTLENIRLCRFEDNYKKAYLDRINGTSTSGLVCKAVIQLSMKGEYIREYHSITEVQRQLNLPHQNIVKVCQGKRKSCGGYKWVYK